MAVGVAVGAASVAVGLGGTVVSVAVAVAVGGTPETLIRQTLRPWVPATRRSLVAFRARSTTAT